MHLIPGIHDINTEFLTSVLVVHLSVQFKKKNFLDSLKQLECILNDP